MCPVYSTNYRSSETGPVGQRNSSHCLVSLQEEVHTGKGAKTYPEILRKSCSCVTSAYVWTPPGRPSKLLEQGLFLQTCNLWQVTHNSINHRRKIHNDTIFTSLFAIRKMRSNIVCTKKWILGSNLICFTWTWCLWSKSRLKLRKLRIRLSSRMASPCPNFCHMPFPQS